jgi:hypothetical protein
LLRSLRSDLLSLSIDDLVALSNRGNVKRAQREIEANECSGELNESPEGALTARWSDGVECQVPAGVVLRDGRCSCAATGLCRHLIRTVLAYQRQSGQAPPSLPAASAVPPAATDATPEAVPPALPAPISSWDPGAIMDDQLAAVYPARKLTQLRTQFDQGVLVELVRGVKPSARFHLQACLVRFQVPGDPRYSHCDCAEEPPCSHVPLAVWAFRLLETDRPAGIVAAGVRAEPAPAALLDEVDALLTELAEQGLAGAASAWSDRLTRLESHCRNENLVWPAEVLLDVQEQKQRYTEHDARFAPERLADLVGEMLIRCDAIRADTGALPQLLIRGSRADRELPLGRTTFVGLGCSVSVDRHGAELSAYLQASDSGSLVVISRDFPDPPEASGQEPRPFHELARSSVLKGHSFATVAAGKLQLNNGKRSPRFELKLPVMLKDINVQPSPFNWETLRAPVLAEDWAELSARLSTLPPSSLRPRRLGEDFHVVRTARAEGAQFVSMTQTIQAVLFDGRNESALLQFPFTGRGQAGAEKLLNFLRTRAGDLRYVSGVVRRAPAGLVLEPAALVFQDGNRRLAVQPWIEPPADAADGENTAAASHRAIDPLGEFWRQLQAALGELFVLGLVRADAGAARRWRELRQRGEAVGLARVAGRLAPLAETLERKSHTLHWDAQPAARLALGLAVLTRFSQDLTG